jgi:hypothetical protein
VNPEGHKEGRVCEMQKIVEVGGRSMTYDDALGD